MEYHGIDLIGWRLTRSLLCVHPVGRAFTKSKHLRLHDGLHAANTRAGHEIMAGRRLRADEIIAHRHL